MKRTITSLAFVLATMFGSVQEIVAQAARSSSASISPGLNYDQLKAAGLLGSYSEDQLRSLLGVPTTKTVKKHALMNAMNVSLPSIQTASNCEPWIQEDTSWFIPQFTGFPGTAPYYRNDDGSALVNLPFNFCFQGTNYSSLYINNNGNVSFGAAYGTFTPQIFPNNNFTMIAPFWADVDTRDSTGTTGSAIVHCQVTASHIIIHWDSVGYYAMHNDLVNTFQLILTNGSDPIIAGGINNVSFAYKDMQWTTGDASSGLNGFPNPAAFPTDNPAIVGANAGNGTGFYLDIGLFDNASSTYLGPQGFPAPPPYSGVAWLNNKHFDFNWCSTGNIDIAPVPIAVNPAGLCDTMQVCAGSSIFPSLSYLSSSVVTDSVYSSFSNWVIQNDSVGNPSSTTVQINATPADVGYQTITFVGTNSHVPPSVTSHTIVVHVVEGPTANLDPTGTITICGGNSVTLNATSGDYHYIWYLNGVIVQDGTISSYLANSPGVYTVSVGDNASGCSTLSQPTTAIVGGGPVATISVPTGCGAMLFNGGSTTLTVTAPGAASYQWSQDGTPISGATSATLLVTQPGTYCVTAYDASGCPSDVPACTTVSTVSVACGHNGTKVVLCHVPPGNPGNPQTLCIAPSAVPAHLAHHPGDCLGSCDLYYPRLSGGDPVEILDFLAEAYPNPFNNGFTVHVISSEETPITVYIHDITGRIVETHSDISYNTMIGSNLAPGMYSAEVVQGDNRQMINILKADR